MHRKKDALAPYPPMGWNRWDYPEARRYMSGALYALNKGGGGHA